MAYVSVAEWRPEQVTEWLKGLDNSILSYIHWFSNNEVNGQQLLNLTPDELTHLGVYKLGHQELILEAVQQLRNFHYDLDRENLQFLALKLSCAASSLYSEIRDEAESSSVPTQIMADVANVIHNVKPLVSWLDRPPFSGQIQYTEYKSQLLSLSLEMATSAQRDRFAERPVAEIRTCSSKLAKLAESIIQNVTDPMILQPATLDLATIKKKAGEDLDFFLVPSFHGIHQIGDMKLSSPAHQSGKIQQGDEIVQVNYQTVVGWSRKKVLALFEESPNDLLLTLKRRPRHVKMYGQIYMKPYRLPSRKRASPYSRWNDNLPSPRPELLTIPDFETPRTLTKKMENDQSLLLEPSGTSSSSDEEFGQPSDSQSPSSMRLYLSKPRTSIQRRFTLSGPPRPSAHSEQFWRELQLERSWRNNQSNSQINKSSGQNVGDKERNMEEMFQLRDKSASLGNSIASASSRSTTCVPFTKERIGSVKFDLPKFEAFKGDKTVGGEKDKTSYNGDVKDSSEINRNGIVVESNSNNGTESSVRPSLSITELNKIKRNAFFNNMECSEGENGRGINGGGESDCIGKVRKEGSSDRVKRVIENFKSEINKTKKEAAEIDVLKSPGKVMELVENFEKKENKSQASKNKFENIYPEKVSANRGNSGMSDKNNLEKGSSVSVAANGIDNNNKESENKCKIGDKTKELRVNAISDCDKTEKTSFEESFSRISPLNRKTQNSGNSETKENVIPNADSGYDKNVYDREKTVVDKPEQIVTNASGILSVPNRNLEWGTDVRNTEVHKKYSEELKAHSETKKTDMATSNAPASPSLEMPIKKLEEPKKPIPAQRKSKMSPESKVLTNVPPQNLFPLPPKPRTKSTAQLSLDNVPTASAVINQMPPQPPPRPENTFLKLTPPKKNESVVEGRKPEVKCSVDATNRPLAESSVGQGPFVSAPLLVVTPVPQSSPVEVADFVASTPASPVRKLIKPKNSSVASSLFSSGSPEKEKEKEKEKSKSSGGTLESLKNILVLGRKQNVNSPRSSRKKNSLLAKKRNVSVKELMPCDNSGFLYYRNRKGLTVDWTKNYFVLQGSNFYGFKSKESNKADLFIHLPGFTCSVADEVKSKDFPFKIYHTGTVFYFAADSKENLQQWLDSVNLTISVQNEKGTCEAFTFSQTDSDSSDSEPEPETCFPTSPKMKKMLGTSSLPKPARSHQNLALDLKKGQDIQRRFGSLKKLSSRKISTTSNQFSNPGENTEVASLDRKYLRFLGQKSLPTPVPTSDFRSYRRINPLPTLSTSKSGGKPEKEKSKVIKNAIESSTSQSQSVVHRDRDPPVLLRKPLHSSNPSLIHSEMADYRITQERLSEFRRLRNQGAATDSNRLMRAEREFMHEDGFRSNMNRNQEFGGLITLEQFLLRQEEERLRSRKPEERGGPSNDLGNFHPSRVRQTDDDFQNAEASNRIRDHPVQSTASSMVGSVMTRQKKTEMDKPQVAPRSADSSSSGKMKNANMYQTGLARQLPSCSSQDDSMKTFETIAGPNHSRMGSDSGSTTGSNASRTSKGIQVPKPNTKLSYQGIEYPPAFEPETYNLQHMLRHQQKRSQNFKK